jgi:hypothetical protein
MTPTSDKITLLFHMLRQFQDNSTQHLNKSLFRHNYILIRKDGVHVKHIKTSIRHINTGFAHDNMTFWNNKTVFRQVNTTFWHDKMKIWPKQTTLRQIPIQCWQANTSITHNKTLLGKNKTKWNNMRQLWRSIHLHISFSCRYCRSVMSSKVYQVLLQNIISLIHVTKSCIGLFWSCPLP